ncbi:MAG: pentapeptide repeat-containing protein, partial [Cyanobacteria bacterium J06636_27]
MNNKVKKIFKTVNQSSELNQPVSQQQSIREKIINQVVEGENPSSLNLIFADLKAAKLIGVNLNNMYLSGIELNNANLTGAQLIEADLSEADLSESKLVDALLMGAN